MTSKLFSLLFFISFSFGIYSQNEEVLFRIENESVMLSEFLRIYEKNSAIIEAGNQKNVEDYLKLFVDFKLKVKKARDLGLDTLKEYRDELTVNRDRLVEPYLKDTSFIDGLVKEAYERSLSEIKASHILVEFKSVNDSLHAYYKIKEARDEVLNGKDFSEVAVSYSDDPSAVINRGDLGYFTVFDMVYPFESNSYSTKIGQVSKIFKTKFGYHIVKVHDTRRARGEVEVAHVLIKGNNTESKKRIDEVYNLLIKDKNNFGSVAKKYSEDDFSSEKGGKLDRFGAGNMVEKFEEVSFSLKKANEISKPFQTAVGWHVVKLIKKHPVRNLEQQKSHLYDKVRKSDRIALEGNSILLKLRKKYTIKVFENSLEPFEKDLNLIGLRSNNVLIVIDSNLIYQRDLEVFLKDRTYSSELFEEFKDYQVLEHHKSTILRENNELAYIYKEYQEGLLLFEILQKRIWGKLNNLVEIEDYYNTHRDDYIVPDGSGNIPPLEKVKGDVIRDYQKYLEKKWIEELHRQYKVVINRDVLEKINKSHK